MSKKVLTLYRHFSIIIIVRDTDYRIQILKEIRKMEKKIYAFDVKIGMELKTVWGYAPVLDLEFIDGTVEYNGKVYPTRKTVVTVESDKIAKYTYKVTETVYVNVPEVKAEPVVVNVATADELVMPERAELIAEPQVGDMVTVKNRYFKYNKSHMVSEVITTDSGNKLVVVIDEGKELYFTLEQITEVIKHPVYETGEMVKLGDSIEVTDRYAEYYGCRGRVKGWFIDKHGKLTLDTTADGGTWLGLDEVKLVERGFKLNDLSVGDMVKPNKSYYTTYNDAATVLRNYINNTGEAVVDILYTNGKTSTLPHSDIEVLCRASEVDLYPEEQIVEPSKSRKYTRGFKRTDLKIMAMFRKYFIPVIKPTNKTVPSNKMSVEVIQNCGNITIKLNSIAVPKKIIDDIQALSEETGVKIDIIK